MILWLNGTFGSGKTTTANDLCAQSRQWQIFDPEWVGYMVRANLPDIEVDDFQDLPPWRSLVPLVMSEIRSFTGADLIAVQTVLVEDYWNELRSNLSNAGTDVFHVVLDCAEPVLLERIKADDGEREARAWRTEHVAKYRQAKQWMAASADLNVDTTDMTPNEVASTILGAVSKHM